MKWIFDAQYSSIFDYNTGCSRLIFITRIGGLNMKLLVLSRHAGRGKIFFNPLKNFIIITGHSIQFQFQ